MEQDPLEYYPPVKKEKIGDEEIAVKEELEYKDCNLVIKSEIEDDMETNFPHFLLFSERMLRSVQ